MHMHDHSNYYDDGFGCVADLHWSPARNECVNWHSSKARTVRTTVRYFRDIRTHMARVRYFLAPLIDVRRTKIYTVI